MDILFINRAEVERMLSMKECISVLEETLAAVAGGDGVNPLRSIMKFPGGNGVLGLMPACLTSAGVIGIKVITAMPGNHSLGVGSHQGMVLLFEMKTGCPLAVIDAGAITAIRTAAASAVATKLLARKTASSLAILGSGVQAKQHLVAMFAARNIEVVRIWNHNEATARQLCELETNKWAAEIGVAGSVREAVAEADIICTVTASHEPLLEGNWLSPGTHINAVGACTPNARELDADAVAGSRLYVDSLESVLNEAGDFLIPANEGRIDERHIVGTIGELLLNRIPGRKAEKDITLFKSLGIAAEDLAAAHYVYEKSYHA